MSKYPLKNKVNAVYDRRDDNPFQAAMPELFSPRDFMSIIASKPVKKDLSSQTDINECYRAVSVIRNVFLPMDYMYYIYSYLYKTILATYSNIKIIDKVTAFHHLHESNMSKTFSIQAESGAILGVPGIGKTSTIKRCLHLFPQVIEHTQYKNHPHFCKQVLYLLVECPSSCSVKDLILNIMQSLDNAIGSSLFERLAKSKLSISSLVFQIKTLCMTYNVGIIVIDEIQNVVATVKRTGTTQRFIKFLVELMNDTGTSVLLIGTLEAEEIFQQEEHLARRTRGYRLLPLKFDKEYRELLKELWHYQYTMQTAPLTEDIVQFIYNYTKGIPSYISKWLYEAQIMALSNDVPKITKTELKKTFDFLAFQVPHFSEKGVSISDFTIRQREKKSLLNPDSILTDTEVSTVKPIPITKKGPKTAPRDEKDLLVWNENDCLLTKLHEYMMIEEVLC